MYPNLIYKQIRKISLINLIIPGFLSIFLIIFYFQIPFEDILSPRNLESAEYADEFYTNDIRLVNITFDTLYYSGYNRMKNDRISGYYYYTLNNGKCTFVLIDPHKLRTPPAMISGYSMKASLKKQEHLLQQMNARFSKDLNWTKDGLASVTSLCYIDETGYQESFYLVLGICLFIFCTMLLSYLLFNITYIAVPSLCPACIKFRQLCKTSGSLDDVNRQLCEDGNFCTKYITCTKDYMVYRSRFHLEMIPFDAIRYIRTHTDIYRFWNPHRHVSFNLSLHCRLHLRGFMPGISKREYRKILEYLQERNITVK